MYAASARHTDKTIGNDNYRTNELTHDRRLIPMPKPWYARIWNALTKFTCPKCNESSGVETDKDVVRSSDHIETVMEEEEHYDREERYKGSTHRPVQVTMRTVVFDQNYRCEDCEHTWSERKTSTFQP
jgi:hypothetical protein